MSPKIFGFKAFLLASPEDIMRNKQLTYLDMPPDMQTPPPKVRPDANAVGQEPHCREPSSGDRQEDAGGVAQGWAAEAAGTAVSAG